MTDRYLIEYFTMGRSGSHAVMNWLCNQFPDPVLYFNNAKIGVDPALEMRAPTISDMQNIVPLNASWFRPAEREKLRTGFHPVMIVGFERINMTALEVIAPIPVDSLEGWIRPSKRARIIVIRDVLNWLASRIRYKMKRSRSYNPVDAHAWMDDHIATWKTHAREALGRTNYLSAPGITKVVIRFNDWVRSPEYRSMLLFLLGVEKLSDDTGYIVNVSGGSSFDARTFQGRAGEMEIENRFKFLEDDKRFQSVLEHVYDDKELMQLNRDVFGDVYHDHSPDPIELSQSAG
jgi:hypothetical protein